MSSHLSQDLSKVEDLLSYLKGSPFESDSASPLSGGGSSNHIFRIYLRIQYLGRATLILKHAKDHAMVEGKKIPFATDRQVFEVESLTRVRKWLPESSLVTVPMVHRFDGDSNVIIMDDCGESAITLREMMLRNIPSLGISKEIGSALGEFLARLHQWGRGNESLLDIFDKNQQARMLSAWSIYGRLESTLKGEDNLASLSDPPFQVSQSQLEFLSKLASERTLTIASTRETFTMGDFWTGNIMISVDEATGVLEKIHVVDWELARPGMAGLEIGQFGAVMRILQELNPPSAASVSEAFTAFLRSYRTTHGELDSSVTRVALTHAGAHLVIWAPRIPWASKETPRQLVQEGLDYLVQGADTKSGYLETSFLSPLI